MRFQAVKDPVTGRIDMIPYLPPQWGDVKQSEVVASVYGVEKYQRFYPESFDGKISEEDFHDAAIINFMSFMAPHANDQTLEEVTQNLKDASLLVRGKKLKQSIVAFQIKSIPGMVKNMIVIATITSHEMIVANYSEDGELASDPMSYWNENGLLKTDEIPYVNIDEDMLDAKNFQAKIHLTAYAIASERKQQKYAPNIVDMGVYRIKKHAFG